MLERLLTGVRPEMRARTSLLFILVAWGAFFSGLLVSWLIGIAVLAIGLILLRVLATGAWAVAPRHDDELRPAPLDQGVGAEADGPTLDLQARVEARLRRLQAESSEPASDSHERPWMAAPRGD